MKLVTKDPKAMDHKALSRAFRLMEDALELLDSAGATLAGARLDHAIEALAETGPGIRVRREESIVTPKIS